MFASSVSSQPHWEKDGGFGTRPFYYDNPGL